MIRGLPDGAPAPARDPRDEMNTFLTVVAVAFVVGTLAVLAYVLYELSPFAHHSDVFHGREHQQSPHLE
jgi:hypothetical protein